MNKSILIKSLFIVSCTLLTACASQQTDKENGEAIVITKQSLSEVNYDTLAQKRLDGDRDDVLDKHDQCPNSPVGHKVDQYGCAIYPEIKPTADIEPAKEQVITVSLLVNFDNDKYNVDEKYFDEINRVAKFLQQYPEASIIIEGHTSSQGHADYNKKLSQKRANEIVKVLTQQFAIDGERLSAQGYGEEQLLDLADTTEAHTKNRRVEGKISTDE